MKKTTLSILMVSLLAACASQKPKEEPKAPVKEAAKAEAPATGGATTQAVEVNPLKDPNNILSHRSVYYDFDKSIVQEQFMPMIKAHAEYLKSHPDVATQLQGNCDERGSREYNLALGQRRADSVKHLMAADGVADKQISTVSFGKEKPRAEGHNEEAWSQNRRTDITYKGD